MLFTPALDDLASLEIPTDSASLSAAVRLHDRYTAHLACALATFGRGDEWAIEGYTSAIAWLRAQGVVARDAALLLKIGQRMLDLPAVAAAWRDGRVTGGQVQAISARVIDRHLALFQQHEAELIESFEAFTVDETIQVMGEWRRHADAVNEGPAPDPERCEARLSPTLDDRGLLTASLDAEGYALASAALALADSQELETAAPLRRGQALKDVFRFFLDNQNVSGGRRNRPHLNIVVRAESIGTDHVDGYDALSGMTLPPQTLERLLCDCDAHRVMASAGAVLDYGHTTKTPSVSLYNAVLLRDRGCRFKGCDRPASWCDAHHVKWWGRDFGPTSLDNLVLLCGRHHTQIHRKGWSARLLSSGDFEVTDPGGVVRSTQPPGAIQQEIPDRYRPYDAATDRFADHFDAVDARRLTLARLATARAVAA